jgi:hypothetical protein
LDSKQINTVALNLYKTPQFYSVRRASPEMNIKESTSWLAEDEDHLFPRQPWGALLAVETNSSLIAS